MKDSHDNEQNKPKGGTEARKTLGTANGEKAFVIRFLTAFLVLYCCIYALFCLDGPLPSGLGLSKADWLQFAGMFLAFGGAVFIGAAQMRQQSQHRCDEQRRRDDAAELESRRRSQEIQPVFGIRPDTRPAPAPNGTARISVLRLHNGGNAAITNVFVGDSYALHGLPANAESPIALAEELVVRSCPGGDIELAAESPREIEICYDDADGVMYQQVFRASTWQGELYFSLDLVQPVADVLTFREYTSDASGLDRIGS